MKCEGCQEYFETGEETLQCEKLGKNENHADYSWFYSDLVSTQILVGKVTIKKLKKRGDIREEITSRKS